MVLRSDSSADRVAAPTFSSTSASSPHLPADRSPSARGRPRPDVDDTADHPPPSTCTRPIPPTKCSPGRPERRLLARPTSPIVGERRTVLAPDLWRSLSSVGEGQRQRARMEDGRDEVSVCRRDQPAVGQLTGRMFSVKGCAAGASYRTRRVSFAAGPLALGLVSFGPTAGVETAYLEGRRSLCAYAEGVCCPFQADINSRDGWPRREDGGMSGKHRRCSGVPFSVRAVGG